MTASGERAAVVNEADEMFVREYVNDVRSYRFEGGEREKAVAHLTDVLRDLGQMHGDVLAGTQGGLVLLVTDLGADVPVEIEQPREPAHLVEEPA